MRPDPGQNFASDEHRRVMANLPNPDDEAMDVSEVAERVFADDFLDLSDDELVEILADLEADGDAEQNDGAWKNTEAGFEVLTGPPAEAGGRRHDRTET